MQMRGSLPVFDLSSFLKIDDEIEKFVIRILKDGAKVWLEKAESLIPVWSGSSRATLVKLAQAVDVNISIFPVPSAPGRVGDGNAKASNTWRGNDRSGGGLIIQPPKYAFFYRIEDHYLIYNNENDANTSWNFHLKNPGPYNFLEAADKAFTDYVDQRLQRGSKIVLNLALRRALRVTTAKVG